MQGRQMEMKLFSKLPLGRRPGEQAWRFTHPSLMTVAANGLMNFPEAKDLEVSIQFLIFLNVGS